MRLRPAVIRSVVLGAVLAVLAAGTATVPAAAGNAALGGGAHSAPIGARQAGPGANAATPGLLADTGSITGVILGVTGQPLARTCAVAHGAAAAVPAVTSAGGRYLLSGLRPGRYRVSFGDCGTPGRYLRQWYRQVPGAGTPGQVMVMPGERIRLDPVTVRPASPAAFVAALRSQTERAGVKGGQISGVVRSRSGKRLAGICVEDDTAGFGSDDVTSAHGWYHLQGLTAGRYRLLFTTGCGNNGDYAPQWWRNAATSPKATWIRVTAKTRRTGVNAMLGTGAVITGTVRARTRSGRPLRGVCASATGLGAMNGFGNTALTRSDGTYRLAGLGTGKYRIDFLPGCGGSGNYLPSARRKAVRVTDGKTVTGIDGVLQPAGQIRGVVTGPGHKPLHGICVVATDNAIGGNEPVRTSARGAYHLGGLAPGRYDVGFVGGCGNGGSYAPQVYPGRADLAGGTAVRIGIGQTRRGVDAMMRPGGAIAGVVTDGSGQQLTDVCVDPVQAGGPYFTTELIARLLDSLDSGSGVSQNGGAYQIRNLWPGLYDVAFFACGSANYASRWFRTQGGVPLPVSVPAGTVTSGISAVMRPGGTISGVVTENGRNVDNNACVYALPRGSTAAFQELGGAGTGPHRGGYSLPDLLPGKYVVEAYPCYSGHFGTQWYPDATSPATATPVTVTGTAVTSGINIAVTRSGSISGRVTSRLTGRPLRRVCAEVLSFDPANPGPINFVNLALTGRDGRYRVGGLGGDGSYGVAFEPCTGRGHLAPQVRARVHVSAPGDTGGVDAAMGRAGTISGTVTGQPSGRPAPGICVTAYPVMGHGDDGTALTGPGGGYRMPGLAPGTYRVLFAACTPGPVPGAPALAPQWYRDEATRQDATLVRITAGKVTSGIGAAMAAAGAISGAVTTTAAAPLAGVCVTAIPAGPPEPGARAVLAETSSTGGYEVSGLAPGSYQVKFDSGCGAAGYATQWWQDAASQASATAITVTPGSVTTGISAALSQ